MSKKIRNYLIFSVILVAVYLFLMMHLKVSSGGGWCARAEFGLFIQPILAVWSIVTSIILFPKNSLSSPSLRFFLIIVSLVVIFFLLRGISLSILDINSISGNCGLP